MFGMGYWECVFCAIIIIYNWNLNFHNVTVLRISSVPNWTTLYVLLMIINKCCVCLLRHDITGLCGCHDWMIKYVLMYTDSSWVFSYDYAFGVQTWTFKRHWTKGSKRNNGIKLIIFLCVSRSWHAGNNETWRNRQFWTNEQFMPLAVRSKRSTWRRLLAFVTRNMAKTYRAYFLFREIKST